MSHSESSPRDGTNRLGAQNLPPWMSSRDKSDGKKTVDPVDDTNGDEVAKQDRGKNESDTKASASKDSKSSRNSVACIPGTMKFPKLLEGVVFVLSGFVNPERSILRSRALEMGAEYQPDWNSDCTLLVCAFPNTPKFRQVEEDCGTIISKEWITECYNQKKLVDIESYIMHPGKPWRKCDALPKANDDPETCSPRKPKKCVQGSHAKPAASALLKTTASSLPKEYFPPPEVKKWAVDDFNRTVKWLDSLDDKPEPSEMKKISVEGILTCLQDAISSLEKKQNISQMADAWLFIPRVVDELAKLDENKNGSASVSKEDILKQAVACKHVYEAELNHLSDEDVKKKSKTEAAPYDSDETVEMTEEEIQLAYNSVASSICR